jgi:predicted transcriptional regulator
MAEDSDIGPPIPAHLELRVPDGTRKALQHSYRRQILRVLHRDVQKLSAAELAESGLVPCSISCAAYHLRVLEEASLVATAPPATGSPGQCYSAALEGHGAVLAVLQDTALSDEQHLGGRSS